MTSFTADVTAATTGMILDFSSLLYYSSNKNKTQNILFSVSGNGVSGIMVDYMAAEADFMKNCVTAIQNVASMSLESLKMVCQQ